MEAFKVCLASHLCWILCNPVDYIAHQTPLSMGFSTKEYWSGLLFPSPGYLPNPGIKPGSSALQVDLLFTIWTTGKNTKLIASLQISPIFKENHVKAALKL